MLQQHEPAAVAREVGHGGNYAAQAACHHDEPVSADAFTHGVDRLADGERVEVPGPFVVAERHAFRIERDGDARALAFAADGEAVRAADQESLADVAFPAGLPPGARDVLVEALRLAGDAGERCVEVLVRERAAAGERFARRPRFALARRVHHALGGEHFEDAPGVGGEAFMPGTRLEEPAHADRVEAAERDRRTEACGRRDGVVDGVVVREGELDGALL